MDSLPCYPACCTITKMKIFRLIPLPLIVLIIVGNFIYSKYFTYALLIVDEAVITEAGKVVNVVSDPGVHMFNAFSQEVHIFNVQKLTNWTNNIHKKDDYVFRIYWKIENSKSFFEQSKSIDIENELKKIFLSAKQYIESDIPEKSIKEISFMKAKNWDYTDSVLKEIRSRIQDQVKLYGVGIYQIDFMAI